MPLEEGAIPPAFSWGEDYLYAEELRDTRDSPPGTQWALLEFDHPITVPLGSIVIGSRLDADINVNQCRLAFHGKLLEVVDTNDAEQMKLLQVYKPKRREGRVDRVQDAQTLLGKDLFKKETDMSQFIGMQIVDDQGNAGKIEGAFGKSGKFKIHFPEANFEAGKKGQGQPSKLFLDFRKYLFKDKKSMVQ